LWSADHNLIVSSKAHPNKLVRVTGQLLRAASRTCSCSNFIHVRRKIGSRSLSPARDPCCYTDAQVISTGRLWVLSRRKKFGMLEDSASTRPSRRPKRHASSRVCSRVAWFIFTSHGFRLAIRFATLIEWYDEKGTGLTYKQESNQDFVECSVSGSVLQAVTEPPNILQIVLQSTVSTSYVACRLLSTDSGKTCNS
jgi:hypothetical protein